MMMHTGRCLCGALRYETLADPIRVTLCHCRFCQRATGGAYMVEPIFQLDHLRLIKGEPKIYHRPSGGSGKMIYIHFCAACGTKLWLTFERFPGFAGVYAGTFDDPNWFEIRAETSKQIFTSLARPDTVLPPHIPAYAEHAMLNDGTPRAYVVYDHPHIVGRTR